MITVVPRRGHGKRLLFIKPSSYDRHGRLVKGPKAFFPSRTLPYLAALTPPEYDVRVVNDFFGELRGDEDVDLAVFTGMLTNMPRAVDLARAFQRHGTPTVIGGIGVMSVGDLLKASDAFTTIVHGEAEGVWPELLADYANGRLKPHYEGGRCHDLSGLPLPRYDLVELHRYHRLPGERMPFLCVETSRGCPHNCSFCGVSLFFGRRMRHRPVGDVVDEMKRLGGRYFIMTDDNLMANPDRARELFAAMKPLNIQWGGQFDTLAARHPDILRLAAESGCRHAVVGVESLDEQNLQDVNKNQNLKQQTEDVIAAFRDAGIAFTASLIFGLDHDTPESLSRNVSRLMRSKTDFILPWTLTPGPGSVVFDEFKREGRLLHEDFSLYNGIDVVFRPRNMTPAELEQSQRRAMRRFYSLYGGMARTLRARRPLDVMGLSMYFWHIVRQGSHPFSGAG